MFAGFPLAILVFFAFVVVPLMPLEPRQVCERFMNASSEEAMKSIATKNLWPAIGALARSTTKGPLVDAELTDESPAPANIGGYAVGFRLLYSEFGQDHRSEGFFHLVQRSGEWKIDDMVVIAVDHQPLQPWMLLSRDYGFLVTAERGNANGRATAKPPGTVQNEGAPKEKQWFQNPGVFVFLKLLFASKAAKGIGIALLAAVVAITKYGKGLAGLFSTRPTETK